MPAKRRREVEEDDEGAGCAPPKRSRDAPVLLFSDFGEVLSGDEAAKQRNMLRSVLKWDFNPTTTFPGAQVVSLTRDNLHLLHRMEYMVTWKADGGRYLLLTDAGAGCAYTFDRKMEVRRVQLHFPEYETDTVLDGEMCVDVVEGVPMLAFYVFDVVAIRGICVDAGPIIGLRDRLAYAKQILAAREAVLEAQQPLPLPQAFEVKLKLFVQIQKNGDLKDYMAYAVNHSTDGYVFTPINMPYVMGTCYTLLKWKPDEHNSIDFYAKRGKDAMSNKWNLYVRGGGSQGREEELFGYTIAEEDLQGKIVECTLQEAAEDRDAAGRVWTYLKTRTDKRSPNHITVAKAVMDSYKYPIDETELWTFVAAQETDIGRSPGEATTLQKVTDFIRKYASYPGLELEAKLGTLRNRDFKHRVMGPLDETIAQFPTLVFDSSVSEVTYVALRKRFVTMTDMALRDWTKQKAKGVFTGKNYVCTKTLETDYIYSGVKGKKRVTCDTVSNKVLRVTSKRTQESLDIYTPRFAYDIRISANEEQTLTLADVPPKSERPSIVREKERLSFNIRGRWSVDLTKITSRGQGVTQRVTYEVEVECLANHHLLKPELPQDFMKRVRDLAFNATMALSSV